MITIYKYPLRLTKRQTIALPPSAQILSAQVQGPQLVLWARLDGDERARERVVLVVGTGRDAAETLHMDYVSTVQAGDFVWHVFAEKAQ